MKRTAVVFLCLILSLCGGCVTNIVKEIERKDGLVTNTNSIVIEKGVYRNKERFIEGEMEMDCIPTEDVAIGYGYLLLQAMTFDDYEIVKVFFDIEDQFWVLLCMETLSDEEQAQGIIRLGGGLSIAISKKSGAVLYISTEE